MPDCYEAKPLGRLGKSVPFQGRALVEFPHHSPQTTLGERPVFSDQHFAHGVTGDIR